MSYSKEQIIKWFKGLDFTDPELDLTNITEAVMELENSAPFFLNNPDIFDCQNDGWAFINPITLEPID